MGSLEGDEAGKKLVLDAGMKITDPTPEEVAAWEKGLAPAVQKWVDDCKAAGIKEPMVFLNAWKEIRAKYLKLHR